MMNGSGGHGLKAVAQLVHPNQPSTWQQELTLLLAQGINSVDELLMCDIDRLAKQTAIPLQVLRKYQEIAESMFEPSVKSALLLFEDVKEESDLFATGCPALDKLLCGGLLSGEVTECVGPSGVGKTQLCMMLATRVVSTLDAGVLYIDTSHSFSPERVIEMYNHWQRSGVNVQQMSLALSRIRYVKVFNAVALLETLENTRTQLATQATEFASRLRVVIIDSIAGVIAPVLGGKHSNGHAVMNSVIRSIKSLASQYQLAFLIINHTVAGVSGSKPALGESWTYMADTRICMSLPFDQAPPASSQAAGFGATAQLRTAVLTKSSKSLCGASVCFDINQGGLFSPDSSTSRNNAAVSGSSDPPLQLPPAVPRAEQQ